MKSPNAQSQQEFSRFLLLCFVSCMLILGDKIGLLSPVKGYSLVLTGPLKIATYRIGANIGNVASVLLHYSDASGQREKILRTDKENDLLRVEVKRLLVENENLRKQIGAEINTSYSLTPATVLGISRFMQLTGGEKDGIKPGMSVVDGKVLIGKVHSVTNHTSLVVMPTDPDANISVITTRQSRGALKGQFGEKIYVEKILQKDPLFIDDEVVTAGDDGYVPGLLIGKITRVESQDTDPYKRGEVDPPVDYDKEITVFVITGV